MQNKNRVLAYCSANKETATRFDADLSKAGISFTHIMCSDATDKSSMAKELLAKDGDIFMMVSDDFLKSSNCMMDALELLSKGLQENRIQVIIVDSMQQEIPGGPKVNKPTQFSRISDLINYMNFWQEHYLKLRKTKNTIEKSKLDEFEKELKRVRIISAEVGEFLRLLRDTDYWTMETLQKDHYALFFNKIGKQDLIIPFQKSMADDSNFNSEEEELSSVKKELNIATKSKTDTPIDPEEQEAIRLTALEKEQQETKEIFSDIFEEKDAKEKSKKSRKKEGKSVSIENDSETISQWEDIIQKETFDHDISISMANRFFEKIDELIASGDEIAATKELQQFLHVNTKSAEAHYRLASIELSNEAYDKARKHCEQAVELQPEEAIYHLYLGRILFHHFRDEPKLAERSFKNAIQLNPANKAAHYEYAMLLHEVLGKSKKAIGQLELTLAIAPDHPFANYDLALIYYSMKKRKKAAKYYEKAFTVNPELRTPDNDIAFWYEKYFSTEEEHQQEELEEITNADEQLMSEETKSNVQDLAELLEETSEKASNTVEESALEEEIIDPHFEETKRVDKKSVTEKKVTTIKKQPVDVKTILITGATSGIGKATATLFAQHGHRLILTGRREGRLNKLKRELEANYQNDIYILAFDVRYQSIAKKSLNSLPSTWENIDLLINNAGLAKGFAPIQEGDLKHWEIMLDTNVKGLLFVTRIIAPGMVARGEGQIINVCSSAGHEVYPSGAVYCATKHAVDALTKGMRLDLFKHGIRVGQVSPGHVEETEFALVRFDGDKERSKIYNDFQPLKSSDVADAIYYMANTPKHVTIHDMVLMGTQQASNVFIDRSGR